MLYPVQFNMVFILHVIFTKVIIATSKLISLLSLPMLISLSGTTTTYFQSLDHGHHTNDADTFGPHLTSWQYKFIRFWMRNFHRHLYIVRSSITKHVNDIACSVWMEKANLNLLLFFQPNTDFALHYWNSHFKYSDLNLLQMISVQMIIRVCQWKVFEPPYMRLTLLSYPKC